MKTSTLFMFGRMLGLMLLACLSCSCGLLLLASPPETSGAKDVIRFATARPDFRDTIERVGKQEGYVAYSAPTGDAALDPSIRKSLFVELKKGVSFGEGYVQSLTGHVKVSHVAFDSADNGQTWNCSASVVGNFSDSDSDTALKMWKELKAKLLAGLEMVDAPQVPGQTVAAPKVQVQTKPAPKKSGYSEMIYVR